MELTLDTLLSLGVLAVVVVLGVIMVMSNRTRRADEAAVTQAMIRMQETTDRISTEHAALTEKFGTGQSVLADRLQQTQNTLNTRLESLNQRLGDGLAQQTRKTTESLGVLQERLAVIDAAQQNITDLSEQMVGLQDILSNKQARGAFGEIQLNDLVSGILPPNAFETQATLSNNRRADCLLKLPNPPGPIVIDAKFPLESFETLRNAEDDVTKEQARRAFSANVKKHVMDIAERYIIPGETAESALMFLPSEAVYAELHATFRNVVEESFRRRVWIVSPTTLMATLNTVRAVLKDARMKEQAGVIQKEVLALLDDVGRLDDRVGKLKTHFAQAEKDIDGIETSSRKISSRGEKIEAIQLGENTDDTKAVEPPSDVPPITKMI